MRKEFKRVCGQALRNLPALDIAVFEAQRTYLFELGSQVYLLRNEEIIEVYNEVFGWNFYDKPECAPHCANSCK